MSQQFRTDQFRLNSVKEIQKPSPCRPKFLNSIFFGGGGILATLGFPTNPTEGYTRSAPVSTIRSELYASLLGAALTDHYLCYAQLLAVVMFKIYCEY